MSWRIKVNVFNGSASYVRGNPRIYLRPQDFSRRIVTIWDGSDIEECGFMFQYPNGNIGPRLGCEYRGKLYFESLDQVYNMIDRQRGYDDDDDDDDDDD